MKTDMKMIAAIVAALAAVLGAGAVLADASDAADAVEPAIWPAPAADGSVLLFEPWTPITGEKAAVWTADGDYTYWLDTVKGSSWITILGNTQVDFGGHWVAYREKAILPAGVTDPRYADVELEFYNDFEGNTFSVVNTTVTPVALNDLSKCQKIETTAGTVYIGGLDVTISGRYYENAQDVTGKAYTKLISVPVLLQKINLADFDESYEYTFNGLWQTPLSWLADNANATPWNPIVSADNAVPYAAAEDNNGKAPFEYPEELDGIVAEDEWVFSDSSILKTYKTNKLAKIETYTIEISAPENESVTGKITITWVIQPLGLDDFEFTVYDPYYDFDNEVRPKVVGVWYEPEDGPNGAAKHVVDFTALYPDSVSYTMPEDYPYCMGYDIVPSFEQAKDAAGRAVTEKITMPKYEEFVEATDSQTSGDGSQTSGDDAAADASDPANLIVVVTVDGIKKFDASKPVYKLVDGEKVPAMDIFGNPVEKQSKDADGNLLWELTDKDGQPMDVTFRYSDMTFVYEKTVDENGNIVDDTDKPVMVSFKIPVRDSNGEPVTGDDGKVVMEECKYYLKPVMEPVYEQDTMELTVPVYDTTKPVMVQKVDEYGRPVFAEFLYNDLTYWNGEIVYEKEVKNGKVVDKLDANGQKIPVKDLESPQTELIYVEFADDFVPNDDGVYTYITFKTENDVETAVSNGTTKTKPVAVEGAEPKDVGGTYYMPIAVTVTDPDTGDETQVPAIVPVYDEESDPVMEQAVVKIPKAFTATQVGVPDEEVFVYGVRVAIDTALYEFDTADYLPSYIQLPEPEEDDDTTVEPVTPAEPTPIMSGDNQVYVELIDGALPAGNYVFATITGGAATIIDNLDVTEVVVKDTDATVDANVGDATEARHFKLAYAPAASGSETEPTESDAVDITKEIVGCTVPGPAYAADGETELYKPVLTVVDENGEVPYLALSGVVYDPTLFTWSIEPLAFEPAWYDAAADEIVVPAGYKHVTWSDSDKEKLIVNPSLTLAEDYTIVPLLDRDEIQYCDENPDLIKFPYYGQYDNEGMMVYFDEGSNFYNDLEYKPLFLAGMLNVDTITVVGKLTADDVDELKNAVHFYAVNLNPFVKPITVEDFEISVMDGDGDLIIYEDEIVRTSLDSDMYTIRVSGNVANGFFGDVYGVFYIERLAEVYDEDDFEVVDYTAAGRKGVKITGYTGDGGDVVIPDRIGGKMVLAIGDKAFYNNKDLTSVVIGENVRTIGLKAFAGCSKLKSVEISDSVQVIGAYAFYGDKALQKVAFGHGLKAVRDNAFSVDLRLMSFEVEDEKLEVFAFQDGTAPFGAEALNGLVFELGSEKKVLDMVPAFTIPANGKVISGGNRDPESLDLRSMEKR